MQHIFDQIKALSAVILSFCPTTRFERETVAEAKELLESVSSITSQARAGGLGLNEFTITFDADPEKREIDAEVVVKLQLRELEQCVASLGHVSRVTPAAGSRRFR